jgi:hypothetical protein
VTQTPERLAPLGQGCRCVTVHSPVAYVPTRHHIVPQSWGGPTIDSNLVTLCPSSHTAVHRLLDDYVRVGGDPGWETRRHFGEHVRDLAQHAWDHRPEHPTITSLSH